ncbi:uncharacterized protein [Musca autumnalis]|uniref:uncharacterized protein n=1 Tax=Musca autumnalis TaxID=221902 RepID=UPI003CED5EAA
MQVPERQTHCFQQFPDVRQKGNWTKIIDITVGCFLFYWDDFGDLPLRGEVSIIDTIVENADVMKCNVSGFWRELKLSSNEYICDGVESIHECTLELYISMSCNNVVPSNIDE